MLDQFDNDQLTALAQAENPRLKRWVSQQGTSCRRVYKCNLCGCVIDEESARYRMTKHAADAIQEHMEGHLETNNV